MEAYWRFVDDVSRGGSLIQDYTEWLSKQETVFRKEKLSDLMLWFPDDKCWFEFRVSEPSTGKTTKKRVEKEELISSIDAEIPAFDFYIDLFSDEEVQESISGRNLDCYEHLRYVKKLVGFRARFNECLQKILSYTMDQNDCLLADEILAVIEHNDIFDALHTPKTRNILNAFNVWCKIYNTGSQADGQHQPEPKAKSAQETPPPLIEPNEQTYTKDQIESLFGYLKEKGHLDVYTRMEDWLYINGIQQVEGYTFRPIFWNGKRVDLVWLLCLMYPIPGAKPLKEIEKITEVKAKKGIFDKAKHVFLIKDPEGTLYPETTGQRYKKPAKSTFSDTKRGQFDDRFLEQRFTKDVQDKLSPKN